MDPRTMLMIAHLMLAPFKTRYNNYIATNHTNQNLQGYSSIKNPVIAMESDPIPEASPMKESRLSHSPPSMISWKIQNCGNFEVS